MAAIFRKTQSKPASSFVNLDTYTRDDHLVISKAAGDKTYIGRVYEMSPLVGGGGDFATVVQNVFKSAPDDGLIQVSLICEPDHEAAATWAKNKGQGSDTVTTLVQQQRALFESATELDWQDDVPFLNIRTVVMALGLPSRAISSDTLEQARRIHTEFLSNVKSAGFYDARPISAGELAGLYRHFANPFEAANTVALDELLDLKYQIFGPDDSMDFRDPRVGVFQGEVYCAAVTCKAFPVQPFYGMMNLVSGAPFNSGPVKEGGGQRIMVPFILSTTVRVANQRKEWSRVDNAIRSRAVNENFPFKLGNEDPADKLADLRAIKKQCTEDGNKFVYVSTTAFLFGHTREQAAGAAASLKSTLDKLGFDGRDVYDNGLVRWAQCLPLNFSPKIADDLSCEGLMSASSACALLPVYGDNLGNAGQHSERTGAAFVTRRGAVHYWDMWTSNSNFNGLIAANPGAGKSFVLQYIIETELAQGTHVFLCDNGKSSKKYCLAVGGEFNDFGGSGFKPSLNPFSSLTDEEFDAQQETITALFLLMAYENEVIEPGARIATNEAVKAAWGQKREDAEISDVIESLRIIQQSGAEASVKTQVVQAAANLVPRLRAFIESPSRGQYFRGRGTLNPKQQFTVFELGGLGDDEHLKKCVLFFVLNLLLTRIKSIPGKKAIFVDEAHDLLKDESAADVVEGLYLKGRKDEVAIWIIIQSMLKLSKMAAGSVIVNQSPWKLILAQEGEEIDKVFKEEVLTTFASDPYFNKLIRSVQTVKGKFSEILILAPRSYEVVRLYVDRFTSTLFSSEGAARSEVFRLMEEGMSAVDAVHLVMGDQKGKRTRFLQDVVDQLRRFDGLSPTEIIRELRAVLS